MRIGVLALQGAFAEHATVLDRLSVDVACVRVPAQLRDLDGLILPGGESTSMRLLAAANGLDQALAAFAARRPVWCVCAGLILLAGRIEGGAAFIGGMDIRVERNAYGRQRDSFIANLRVSVFDDPERPFPGVFIRAPRIRDVGADVTVLATHQAEPVALRQGRLLATAFHPELTSDSRMHAYFLRMCGE